MEKENDLAIAILNYNGAKWLTQFLPTFVAFSPKGSLFVIDNASTDDSLEVLKNWTDVHLILLDSNYGFCGGYNKGVEQISKPYLILVNSDIEVTANWYKPLLFNITNESVGACQPKILDFSNRTKFEYAGAAGGMMNSWAVPYCYGRSFKGTEIDKGQYEIRREIFWASGACFAIRKFVFQALGGFDEAFFAHMEEIDLCWRLQLGGYKIIYEPGSKVYHVGGGTLSALSPKKTYLNHRNNLYTIYKNYGRGKVALIIWRLVLDGAIGIYYLLRKGPNHAMAVIKAHLHFYKNVRKLKVTIGNGAKFLKKGNLL